MKILAYLTSLLTNIKKPTLQEDLRTTKGELLNVAIPSYRAASEHFKVAKFASKEAETISKAIYGSIRNLKGPKQSSIVGDIERRLGFVNDVTEYLEDQVEKLMERDSIREGLSAKKAVLIRAGEAVSFISRYSVDLLSYLYAAEAIDADKGSEESVELTADQIDFVQKNAVRFACALSNYGVPLEDFKKLYVPIPDVFVSQNSASGLQASFDEHEVDPFFGDMMSGFVGNPIYHIRLIAANWQAARYTAAKEKKASLELRLLHLQMLKEKKNTPQLERDIGITQDRINKLERDMRRQEESVGMDND